MKEDRSKSPFQEALPEMAQSYLPTIILFAIIVFSALCRLRLLGVPLERDEGEYAYVGQELLKGIPPFVSIYHVKMPGIYAAYAFIMAIFGQTNIATHLGLVFVNAFTTIIVFLIARKKSTPLSGALAAVCFSLFTLSQKNQGFSANAEHFVLLFAMPAILLMLYANDFAFEGKRKKALISFFVSGLLFGIAYTMKQHAIFFILFALLFSFYQSFSAKRLATITGRKNVIIET